MSKLFEWNGHQIKNMNQFVSCKKGALLLLYNVLSNKTCVAEQMLYSIHIQNITYLVKLSMIIE